MATLTSQVTAGAVSSSNTTAVTPPADAIGGAFQLDVTAAATDAGDTLDVYIQHTMDGTNYDDFIHFTQVLGNGGAKRFRAQWSGLVVSGTPLAPVGDAAMAASVLQGPVGKPWRVKWVVVDGDANSAFTFTVKASYIRDE